MQFFDGERKCSLHTEHKGLFVPLFSNLDCVLLEISACLPPSTLRLPLSGHLPRQTLMSDLTVTYRPSKPALQSAGIGTVVGSCSLLLVPILSFLTTCFSHHREDVASSREKMPRKKIRETLGFLFIRDLITIRDKLNE